MTLGAFPPHGVTLDLALVVGATGGVGQLTVSKLLEKGIPVRVLARRPDKAQADVW